MTLAIANLEVRYGARVALERATFGLEPGTLVGLIGPNGAGKSSLLRAVAGVGRHTGRVTWRGRELADLSPRHRALLVAYLPQAAAVHWPMCVRDLVALGRLPHRAYGAAPTAADDEAVDWAMQQTETEPFATRSADELSVGERARVLLARALAVRAPVLLVDEPIAMLDPYHQLQIMAVLRTYATTCVADVWRTRRHIPPEPAGPAVAPMSSPCSTIWCWQPGFAIACFSSTAESWWPTGLRKAR